MPSGSISAMNASIKMNAGLRRGRKSYSKFYKKTDITHHISRPLSREENQKIIAEKKKQLERSSKLQRIYAFAQLSFYCGLIGYVLYMVL